MRRASERARRRASWELRVWHECGTLGICDVAWQAVDRAAVRYGYPGANQAAQGTDAVMRDLFSEAIEDLESAT